MSGQKISYFAFDATTNLPKASDAANLTAYVAKDDGALTVLADATATEIDAASAKGYYTFDLTQAETNADKLHFTAKSATANVVVIGVPAVAFTYLSPVSADVVADSRTWFADEYRATNIVEVSDDFAGTLCMVPNLNPETSISTVSSVTITGAATVVATDLTVTRDKKRANFTVPALTTTGTYTVVVTVATTDGQTIPTTGTLKVY